MTPSNAPAAAREFLQYWGMHDRQGLATRPETVVNTMDPASRQVIYVGIHDLLQDLAIRGPYRPSSGELVVYLDPQPQEEYRWQLAAMLADTVILHCPRWDPHIGTKEYTPSLRETCDLHEEEPQLPVSVTDLTTMPSAVDLPLDDIDSLLDEIEAHSEELLPSADKLAAWRNAVLPGALADSLRFLVHLAAIGGSSRVELALPDLSEAATLLRSLQDVYFANKAWHVYDSWIGGSRPPVDVRVFGDILGEINPSEDEIFTEVMGSYELGAASRTGHLALVPSTSTCKRTAVEFYSRFHRLLPGIPMFGGVPQAIPAQSPAEPDWRPALCDEMLLAAFPNLSTANISTFEYLHQIPRLADFRHRLRCDSERLEGCSAAEAAERLLEVSRELRQVAQEASDSLEERVTSSWRNLILTSLGAAVVTAVGFISAGLPEVIGGALIGGSVTAALEHHKLDPSGQFTSSELALMTLSEGRRPRV